MSVDAVPRNPFPGLRPFEPQDSTLFFGRDEQIGESLDRMLRHRLLVMVGVSGCGKSSLVRAGMVPALELGLAGDPEQRWHVATMRPGDGPLRELARCLGFGGVLAERTYGLVEAVKSHLPAGENLLLVVDQFEEIFPFRDRKLRKGADSEADLFVSYLLHAAQDQTGGVYVLLTMRSDYLGECAKFHGLPEALNEGQYLVPRMTRQQLQEAIEGPLGAVGVEIHPALVQCLLNQCDEEPDNLPLLQHLLRRIFEDWEQDGASGPLTSAMADQAGGLGDALDRDAEAVYRGLSTEQQLVAEVLFRRITELRRADREEEDRPVRRPQAVMDLARLARVSKRVLRDVVSRFETRGILTVRNTDRGEKADLPHESLCLKWVRLKDWIRAEAEDAKKLRFLLDAAGQVHLTGSTLHEASEWAASGRLRSEWGSRYLSQEQMSKVVDWVRESKRVADKAAQKDELFKLAQQTWEDYQVALEAYEMGSLAKIESNLRSHGENHGADGLRRLLNYRKQIGWTSREEPERRVQSKREIERLREKYLKAARAAAPSLESPPALATAPDLTGQARAVSVPAFAQPVPTRDPTRFAVPHSSDAAAYRLLTAVAHELRPLPFPIGRSPEPVLELSDVLGPNGPGVTSAVQGSGKIVFHAVGSTGNVKGPSGPCSVASAMVQDFDSPPGSPKPSFFFHLGDVVYNFGEKKYYYDQFYAPYRNYPAPILGLAGNHDGMVAPGTADPPLAAFLENFCSLAPRHLAEAGSLVRTAQIQPGVYFTFQAPFLRIIALYSGTLEGGGAISSQGGRYPNLPDVQLAFLSAALRRAKEEGFEGALILAIHHQSYSARQAISKARGSADQMRAELDNIFRQTGVWPHAVLSGHAHNYQRYTRTIDSLQIPYLVAGAGGHSVAPLGHADQIKLPQALALPSTAKEKTVLEAYYDRGYSYLRIIVDTHRLRIECQPVGRKVLQDSVTVDLITHRIVS